MAWAKRGGDPAFTLPLHCCYCYYYYYDDDDWRLAEDNMEVPYINIL